MTILPLRVVDSRDHHREQRLDDVIALLRAWGRSDAEIRRILDGEIIDLDAEQPSAAERRCA